MIVYVTGAPGSGKTLWTIGEVKRLRDEWAKEHGGEVRPVYYWFPEATASVSEALQWKRLANANEAHACEFGSIIIVDEAWQPWPQGKPGKQPPELEPFATHRHRGHDFYIITQRASSVHHFIRGLIGRHVHFERQFGLERSRKFEWQKLGDPADKWSRKDAMASEFRFPKEVYALYKSSDMHTVQKRLPWGRIAALGGGAVFVVVAIVFVMGRFRHQVHKDVEVVASKVEAQGAAQTAALSQLSAKVDRALEAVQWQRQFEERAPGAPYSASFYDPVLKPAAMPKISGCAEFVINGAVHCSCNTQQGTRITTLTLQQCAFYVRNGWFDPTADDAKADVAASGLRTEPPATSYATAASGLGGSGATPAAAASGSDSGGSLVPSTDRP